VCGPYLPVRLGIVLIGSAIARAGRYVAPPLRVVRRVTYRHFEDSQVRTSGRNGSGFGVDTTHRREDRLKLREPIAHVAGGPCR
jgi:hypothetical protein